MAGTSLSGMTISPWRWSSINPFTPHCLNFSVCYSRCRSMTLPLSISPKKDMILADHHSHLPSHWEILHIKLYHNIQHVHFFTEEFYIIWGAVEWDPVHNTLYHLTLNGWPNCIPQVLQIAQHFWGTWDDLSIENGILIKGNCICNPQAIWLHLSRPPQRPSRSWEDATLHLSISVLAQNRCRHHWLHSKMHPLHSTQSDQAHLANATPRCTWWPMAGYCSWLHQA